jgi:hypothetical protein
MFDVTVPFPEHIDFFCFHIRNFVVAFLSFCSLLSPRIGRGIVAPPLPDGFRSWLRYRECGLANASGRFEFNIVLFMDWFRFRLLSTPPLNDAVTFSHGQASVPVRKGLSPFCRCVLSGAHSQALRAGLAMSKR